MTNPIPRELMEMEFDEGRAIDAAGKAVAEMRDINGEAFDAFRRGARWQFDQNKAQLAAMRAEIERLRKFHTSHGPRDVDAIEGDLRGLRCNVTRLEAENANLRDALAYAKKLLLAPGEVIYSSRDVAAEIEKLERGGV